MQSSDKSNLLDKFQFVSFAENKLPQFKEIKSKGICQYGAKNDFPDTLIFLLNKSSKHNAIVQQKCLYITGEDVNGVPDSLKENWNKYSTMQEYRYRRNMDVKTFGGFAVEVIYDRSGRPQYYNIDFSKIRTLDHSKYFYHKDWTNAKPSEIVEYPKYDKTKAKPFDKQIFYYREYRGGLDVYPLPEYYPALNYIDIDARISNFHLNNIMSGMTAGTLLQFFKGEPTPEEARKFKSKFQRDYTGDGNAGGIIMQFNDPGETPAEVTPLQPNNFDELFLQLNKQVTDEIFIAHQITSPMLLGVKEEGQLGGRNELGVAYEIFYRSYIKPNQQKLDAIDTMFMNDMGVPGKVETVRLEPLDTDYKELFTLNIIDRNEVREKYGFTPQQQVQMSEDDGMNDVERAIFSSFGTAAEYLTFEDLTEKELKVLGVIKDNEKASAKEIAEVVNIEVEEVNRILEVLDQKGKITQKGKVKRITDEGVLKQVKVMYRYSLRSDAPSLVPGGESRAFCQTLIKMNRFYTREEIDRMSAALGYDVWKRRGGWYHNPNTDVNEPACRHEWKQVIVKQNA